MQDLPQKLYEVRRHRRAGTGLDQPSGRLHQIDAEYGLNDLVTFTDKTRRSLSLAITQAVEISAGRHEDMAKNYRLKVDETQRYIYLHMEVTNNTGEEIELYNKRYTFDWLEGKYTDEKIREHFYEPKRTRKTSPAPCTPTPTRWCRPPRCSGPTTTGCT